MYSNKKMVARSTHILAILKTVELGVLFTLSTLLGVENKIKQVEFTKRLN